MMQRFFGCLKGFDYQSNSLVSIAAVCQGNMTRKPRRGPSNPRG
jgi:hypothetical protein